MTPAQPADGDMSDESRIILALTAEIQELRPLKARVAELGAEVTRLEGCEANLLRTIERADQRVTELEAELRAIRDALGERRPDDTPITERIHAMAVLMRDEGLRADRAEAALANTAAERDARIAVADYDNVTRMLSVEQGRSSELYARAVHAEADLRTAEAERDRWHGQVNHLNASYVVAASERDKLKASAADGDAQLATAKELITVLEDRLDRFEETDPDGRALAEWVLTVAVAGSEPKNAARRYLSGIANRAAIASPEPAPGRIVLPPCACRSIDCQECSARSEAFAGPPAGQSEVTRKVCHGCGIWRTKSNANSLCTTLLVHGHPDHDWREMPTDNETAPAPHLMQLGEPVLLRVPADKAGMVQCIHDVPLNERCAKCQADERATEPASPGEKT